MLFDEAVPEALLRLGIFLGAFVVLAALEFVLARRAFARPRRTRWPHNLGVLAVDVALLRILFPLTAVAFAGAVEARGIGILNAIEVPPVVSIVVAMVVLDFAIWLQHFVFHHVPWLWRIHGMHHTDLHVDVTTGVRFHPLEILLSMIFKFAVIALIGAPAVAVLLFEIVLNTVAMFNHANIRLPQWLDSGLRLLIVTPDMHRVHHSAVRSETDSNFGFNLSCWDRLFGSYTDQPRDGHLGMAIGLAGYGDPREIARLDGLLRLPFGAERR